MFRRHHVDSNAMANRISSRAKILNLIKNYSACKYELYLVIASIYVTIMHFIWLRIDTCLPYGTQIFPLQQGMVYFNCLRNGAPLEALKEYFSTHLFPAYSTIVGGFYCLFYCIVGVEQNMDLMFNAVFLSLGMIGMYKCGERLFDKRTGFIAALVWSALPFVINFSKIILYEWFFMCFVPFMFFFWLKSDSFRSRRYSILFGITLGIMIGIKVQGILFCFVPLGHLIVCVIKQRRGEITDIWKRCINAVLGAFFGICVGMHWYIYNWKYFYKSNIWRFNPGQDLCIQFTLKMPFIQAVLNRKFSFPSWLMWVCLAILCVAVICLFIKYIRTKTIENICYVGLFMMVPLLMLDQFYEPRQDYYLHMITFSPFFVLILCGGINLLNNRFIQRCIFGLLLIYGLSAHYLAIIDPSLQQLLIKKTSVLSGGRFDIRDIYGQIRLPDKQGWESKIEHIVDVMIADFRTRLQKSNNQSKPRIRILSGTVAPPCDWPQIVYLLLEHNLSFKIHHPMAFTFKLEDYDYIIQIYPRQPVDKDWEVRAAEIDRFTNDNLDRLSILAEVSVAGVKRITLYKCLE